MSAFRRGGARSYRRGFPIMGFCGPNGGGKSMAMVWDTLPSLLAGRRVLSTVRLLDFENPRECDGEGCDLDHTGATAGHMAAHPLYEPLRDWAQIKEAEHCDLLFDEVTGVASSRASHALPPVIANLLVQLRRRDMVLRWSAPSWARADVIIRECSQAVTYCRGYLPVAVPSAEGEEDRMWRQKRLAQWRTYDATEFEDFTAGKRETMKALMNDWHWIPGSPASRAYDTFDSVSTIGHVNEAGRCEVCGGTKTNPKCSCDDHKGKSGRRAAGAPQGSPPAASPTPLVLAPRRVGPAGGVAVPPDRVVGE